MWNFLAEAEDAGLDPKHRAEEATKHVAGMDIHLVAIIIARVTYLLALAPVIANRAGSLSIPVYLAIARATPLQRRGVFNRLIHVANWC